MNQFIDLHLHSTFSDGTVTPTKLAEYIHKAGLKAAALTDHDTVEGCEEFLAASAAYDFEAISGIEFACQYHETEIHIVGLFVDYRYPPLLQKIKEIQRNRIRRNKKMVSLCNACGLSFSYEELEALAGGDVITRAHYAKLLEKKGMVKNKKEAFDKYLSPGCPCYVQREEFLPKDAIRLLHEAGGLAILAHPTLYSMEEKELLSMVTALSAWDLDGIECMYSTYTQKEEAKMKEIAAFFHLLPSGGSDFHGLNKAGISIGKGHGNLKVPLKYFLELKERQKKRLSST